MEPGGDRVSKFRLTPSAAQSKVRQLSASSSNLIFTRHIEQRMSERGIDTDAVLRILRTGSVDDEPQPTEIEGDWKIKVTRIMPSGRTAGVVTVLVGKNQKLVLLTAEWEDHR